MIGSLLHDSRDVFSGSSSAIGASFRKSYSPCSGVGTTDHQDQEEYEEQVDTDARQNPLAQASVERDSQRSTPGQCLALPDLLSHELSRGQATGLYQRSFGLRPMAHPKWLIAISFNLHSLQLLQKSHREYPFVNFAGFTIKR